VDNAPVATLDLNRYLGEWYEIARFDRGFERGYDTDKLIWVRQDKCERCRGQGACGSFSL
jgi:lipocalin